MLKDRKNYLKNIQRQIFHKKNELSRVSSLVNKSRSMLGDSVRLEDSKLHVSMISIENIDDLVDSEINYLRSVGILNNEIEIDS